MRSVEAANRFLREHYIAEFNGRFPAPAAQGGSGCVRRLQIEPVRWRATLAGSTVTVHQHLDGTFTITHGPQRLGHYTVEGRPLQKEKIGESRTVTETYTALPRTTLQVWQLHAEYVVEYENDGQTYRSVPKVAGSVEDGVVLALTFPETAAAAA
jgi:hypothetical protein